MDSISETNTIFSQYQEKKNFTFNAFTHPLLFSQDTNKQWNMSQEDVKRKRHQKAH